jgi:hypothetical protein
MSESDASLADAADRASTTTRLAAAFCLGSAGGLLAYLLGIPGNGAFVPVVWVAGFVSAVVAPGWRGFLALLGGSGLSAMLLDLADGAFGLVFLVIAIVWALAGHGALSGWAVLRLRAVGPGAAVRDPRLLAGVGVVTVGALVMVWLAQEFARNPA